ncbi:MAG: hypothetical protein HY069_02140 [Chlamydiia bacterium]|nr:hypothetical protein [Chlamydiia bacterium]
MEEIIETKVSPQVVWQAWERFQQGEKGRAGAFKYRILQVEPGKSFSILWKTLFVRLIFTHRVELTPTGSKVGYEIQIKGLFAYPVRWLIGNKIRRNTAALLRSFVKQLET